MANSGEMAVLTGMYETTMKDGTKDTGNYCEIFGEAKGRHLEMCDRYVRLRSAGAACEWEKK